MEKKSVLPKTDSAKDPSPEVRAFIYQQITDLETLLPKGTAVSVVVDEEKVTFQLETSVGNLVVESNDKDVYKAISNAKADLKDQLNTLHSYIVGDDRNSQIENIVTKKYLH